MRAIDRLRLGDRLDHVPSRWRFVVFLGFVIVIAVGLTALSYALYIFNGTAQLDLSRPGYKAALTEVNKDSEDSSSYSNSGPLNADTLKEFKEKFDALVAKTRGYSVFDPSALGDEQLNLNTDTQGSVGPQ